MATMSVKAVSVHAAESIVVAEFSAAPVVAFVEQSVLEWQNALKMTIPRRNQCLFLWCA